MCQVFLPLFNSHIFVAAENTLSVFKFANCSKSSVNVNKRELKTGKLPLGGLPRNSEVKKLTIRHDLRCLPWM